MSAQHFVIQIFAMFMAPFSHGVSDAIINEGHFDSNWRSAAAQPLAVKPISAFCVIFQKKLIPLLDLTLV